MTEEQIQVEERRVALEMSKLNLELMQEQVQTLNEKKESRRQKLARQQRDLEENERIKLSREANCKHKKGGRNKAGLDKGNAPNYAVIQNTYPAGAVQVMCQRCGKTWDEPAKDLKRTNPDLYARQLHEYRTALEWPTDNEPSGTQLFLITKNEPRAARSSDDEAQPATPKKPRAKKPKAA